MILRTSNPILSFLQGRMPFVGVTGEAARLENHAVKLKQSDSIRTFLRHCIPVERVDLSAGKRVDC